MVRLAVMPMAQELPQFYKLGETKAEVHIDTMEECRNAAIALAKQARYGLDIFSQDLDLPVYDNDVFVRHVSELARRHPSVQVRILVRDSTRAVKQGHRLVRLAQTLTSSVHIHKPSREYSDETSSFLVADSIGVLYRSRGDHKSYDATVNFMAPQHAAKLGDYFTEVWDRSTPDPQVRRLYV